MTLLALTLWRPWPACIFHLRDDIRKPVENRGWAPPSRIIGRRIAIHAGKRFDKAAHEGILEMLGYPDMPRAHDEGVIGTVQVFGCVHADGRDLLGTPVVRAHSGWITDAEAKQIAAGQWFSGPYGWVLREPRALPEAMPCKGAQGLWTLPEDVEARVRAQLGEAA